MANQVWNRLSQMTSNYKNSQQNPSLNNNQYSSYYSKLYPWLTQESYNKMVNAVDSLGLTWENRTNAMNNYYRTHVKSLVNDQTLQERDEIINQQAYEAAQANSADADAQLRMTEAVQKAKKLWNLDAKANDLEVFSDMVDSLWENGMDLAWQYLSWENDEFLYKAWLEQREVKKPIEVTWWDIWDNIRTKANVPIDTMKKWGQRTFDKMGALLYKNVLKNTLGDAVDWKLGDMDSYVQFFAEKNIEPRLKENALNYQQWINERYQALEQKNMDQDVKNYYDNKWYTELLSEWDFKWFAYKSLWDAAQNREMPVVVAASVVQPEIWLALMATDTYARENQEAFENMLNNWATYEQAENWAVVVWLINSAVEVWLEKLIGWVETWASDAIRKTFMKNVQEEATKKWLGRILLEWVWTQLRASWEEWLEEIVQQIVQNAAVKTVNENQELFEWVWQAFEWGFYNPMNLLAWGGNLTQNISQNTDTINQQLWDTAYNAGVMTRKTVDGFTDVGSFMKDKATAIKQMAKERLNRKNWQNVTTENVESENIETESTAITPQWTETTVDNTVTDMNNGAIELIDEETTTENNANTDLAETQWGSKFWEAVSWLEDNIKEKIKRNPYAIQESRELIKNMENNPWLDFTEYQNERYESVLDMIEERLKQAEDKRRNDVWGLYTKLEEANAPIDTTNLKNRVAEYQARVEELWDILSSSDKAKIETILKNIQEIWDWTMDIWKVRKIADQWAKYDQWATWDWIRLIRDIRNAIDDEIMAQNPEMKEVDQAYKKAKDEIQDLRGNLTYKKTWEIKSNAVSTVKNMLNANNKKYLSTLEKYIPWITERLQAIRDSKLVYNAYTSWEGSRFVSKWRDFVTKWILAWWGYLLWWPVGAGIWYLISWKVDAAITSLARKWLKETITKETAESKAELERINKKIEENQRLEVEEKAKLKELWDRIMQKMATMDKTDAEQSAWESYLADLEQDEVIDMPEEVYDQWEEVTTTPKKKTSKKKTSKKGLDKNQASSKTAIVDKNWNPKNVYHYSDTDFDTFDMSKQKNKLGIYFSPSSKPNSTLRKFKITATIDMKNPLTISPENKASMIYPELKEYLADEYEDQYDTKFRELLIRDWYDGVIMLDDKWNVSQYVVLNPEQVNVKKQWPIKKS